MGIKLPMYQCPVLRSGQLRGQKSLGPFKISLEMAHKVIWRKKIISRIFKISGTLVISMSHCLTLKIHAYFPSTRKLANSQRIFQKTSFVVLLNR